MENNPGQRELIKWPRTFYRKVTIESPYRGNIEQNKAYLRICMLDSIERGEAPSASHKLYTDVLDDDNEEERLLGIELGFAWLKASDLVAFYEDLGWSPGMKACLKCLKYARFRVPYEIRKVQPHVICAIREP